MPGWGVGKEQGTVQKMVDTLRSAADFCTQVCVKLYEEMYEM
jgi:hypothetical protein